MLDPRPYSPGSCIKSRVCLMGGGPQCSGKDGLMFIVSELISISVSADANATAMLLLSMVSNGIRKMREMKGMIRRVSVMAICFIFSAVVVDLLYDVSREFVCSWLILCWHDSVVVLAVR